METIIDTIIDAAIAIAEAIFGYLIAALVILFVFAGVIFLAHKWFGNKDDSGLF